ncbi:terminase small subunit [Coprococcus sp. AF38-1]|uniref:terminase small subunit n=1 Tax=Coprococcus sp. AF38-1 TaxID=2302943 RepID=UPI001A9B93E1|nr:terminase small subunit [Coprococcus sp. AF38-1]DAP41950.1 MAG TPA: Terminase small subunit [Bacteriophage sp.]
MGAITEKQKRFADEWLVDLNGTRAYKAAYPSVKKDETAKAAASRLLTNVNVKVYIQERQKEREKRTEITQDSVLHELALIAFAKASDYARVVEKDAMVEVDGNMVPVLDEDGNQVKYRTVEPILTDELTEDQKKAIAVIKKGRDGFEIKPYSKIQALELLGKHLGMFTEKVEVKNTTPNVFEGLTTEELKKLIDDV